MGLAGGVELGEDGLEDELYGDVFLGRGFVHGLGGFGVPHVDVHAVVRCSGRSKGRRGGRSGAR